ncbi:MAG TPA: hypothetical protein G4O12_06540 [Dehalococcoidia bacterium]|nr:hypothetical protein [Dehalococcoidia bacterium]
MIVAGVDIGSLTTKAVILKDDKILSWHVMFTGTHGAEAANKTVGEALREAGLSLGSVDYIISTGVGKLEASFSNEQVGEILCAVRGACWLFPSVRTVIDIGAENCRTIKCNENRKATQFDLNDKCAAGTGVFLETMAAMLEVRLEDMGKLSMGSNSDINVNFSCAVFAESEVISLVHSGISKVDILSAIHKSIASRVYLMVSKMGIEKDVVVAGGVAKNVGFTAALSQRMGSELLVPQEPQIMGALGAALVAEETSR